MEKYIFIDKSGKETEIDSSENRLFLGIRDSSGNRIYVGDRVIVGYDSWDGKKHENEGVMEYSLKRLAFCVRISDDDIQPMTNFLRIKVIS